MGYQCFDASINTNGFPNEFYSTGVKFLFEILTDEIKPVVAEKSSLGQRILSLLTEIIGRFALWGL